LKEKLYRAAVLVLVACVLVLLGVNGFLLTRWLQARGSAAPAPAVQESASPVVSQLDSAAVPEPPAPPELASAAAPEEDRLLCTVRYESAPCWSNPTRSGEALMLSAADEIYLDTEQQELARVILADGSTAYMSSLDLITADVAAQTLRDENLLAAYAAMPGYEPFTGAHAVYTVKANSLLLRCGPGTNYSSLCAVPYGTKLTVLGNKGGYSFCQLSGGGYAWCASEYITGEDEFLLSIGAVDLRDYLPEAQFDLLFASPNNVSGHALYAPVPILESGTAAHLKRAYDRFAADGYILKIYDAYRPLSAQYTLYSIVQDSRYIANPDLAYSWHQFGRAVDISLVDAATGEELEMPTAMHYFGREAQRFVSAEWTEAARKNVDYLTSVMEDAGFDTIATEWWHFQYVYGTAKLDANIDLSALAP